MITCRCVGLFSIGSTYADQNKSKGCGCLDRLRMCIEILNGCEMTEISDRFDVD